MKHPLLALIILLTTVLLAAMPAAPQSATTAHLLEQFKGTSLFWQQLEVAKELAKVGNAQVLKALEPLLGHADRHLRANVAFVFARLGDPRGLETIRAILADRSDRPLGQGIPGGSFNPAAPRWWLASQILADRYYAVHILGELKDSRGVDMLMPLLGTTSAHRQFRTVWRSILPTGSAQSASSMHETSEFARGGQIITLANIRLQAPAADAPVSRLG